ncbi:Aerobic respiration control sensor protein ArcB [Rubripirellula obstinata]|uniref:histidine kinase n=1 Tax=Rubripirellula obstinata TaxID=406547 RepID=A0A5B1CIP8_9BACT|nr:chemotaxis protein CheB [Rubripirellula obstinata]KAA1259599.1 Aerobic respiration control sensor protein ArcB [Rubripirellula obstinata]
MTEEPAGSDDRMIGANEPKFVVGIGASAGGLESLEKLFRNLSPDTGMAFVVLQHLSPNFKSMMYELLGRDTAMTIHRAEDGMRVQANSVYLLPPKKEMVIRNGELSVQDKAPGNGLALPIDLFFESLALDCGPQAIAVVLSGSGSDGSRGIVEIAKHGGFVISESLDTAKFDGMPASATATGVVDEILKPEEIGALLALIASKPNVTRTARIAAVNRRDDQLLGMEAIYQQFRRAYEIDFGVYKDTTVLRRVHRRMAMAGIENVDDYADRLADDNEELEALYCDLLIGVTQFFRDPDTFDYLGNHIFPDLIHNCDANQPLRVWVAGCATGEEPYSIAIALHEAFERAGQMLNLKMFATDVHRSSIEHAGRGVYAGDVLQGVDGERLEKYFIRRDDGFQVSPSIRKSIVFAPHNVLSDAPFTDLDLVSCRNMLIYFQGVAQNRSLSMFHYGLRKGGILLLGGSESPGELAGEFDVVQERSRIYRKRRQVRLPNEFRSPLKRPSSADLHISSARSARSVQQNKAIEPSLYDQLLNKLMPPSLLIDENRNLIESFGGAQKFLRFPSRQPSLDILDLVDKSLRTTLSGAISRTLKDNQPVRYSNVMLRVDEGEQAYNLTVTPILHSSISGKHHVISFEATAGAAAVVSEATVESYDGELDASRDHIRQLEDDLRYSRENLQATIEELETSNEELQATNEELIASNEELQSTNEELHSVNEELFTVNSEHQSKITELAELNEDMNHLLENTDVATVFLDKDLCVRRFTSRVSNVFDFVDHDIGRSIKSFSPRFSASDLVGQLTTVIETGQAFECETFAEDGTCYLMRILPYRIGRSVEGVVLMLVNISSMEVLRERLRWMSAIVETSDDAIIGQDLDGMVTSWNSGAERLYGYSAEEVIKKHVSFLIPKKRQTEVTEYLEKIATGQRLHTRDTVRVRKDGTEIHVSITVSPVFDGNGKLIGISKIARDVSERIKMESEIRDEIRKREAFLATLSHELRNPLGAALSASRLIQDGRSDEAMRINAAGVIERQITMTRSLLSDLLDMSRITQGKIELAQDIIDLRSLVDLIHETTLSEADDHRQKISWDLPDSPVYVRGDATRLVQVQVNLIHNALKYSPEESAVNVVIRQDGDQATISVTDFGVGIESHELESIFDAFVQLGDTLGRSEGGLGVGLTLVRTLVEAHGGTVNAESKGRGHGTTVSINLPLASEPEQESGMISDASESSNGMPRTVVLIEDIDDSRKMLSSLLSLDGHIVHACEDGESGAEAILQNCPDLALVDIGLPGIDGYEVARRTRDQPRCRDTHIVALTGFGQSHDVEKALEAGFDGHLVKPIDPDELTKLLSSLPEMIDRN